MSARAIGLKRKGFENGVRKGSPHPAVPIAKSSSVVPSLASVKKSDSSLTSAIHTLQNDLDKENNSTPSVSHKRTKPRNISESSSNKEKLLKTNTSRDKVALKTLHHSPKCSPKQNSGTPSKTTLCAASVLSSSTDALAERHRKSLNKGESGGNSSKKSPMNVKKTSSQTTTTPGYMSPYHATPQGRKPITNTNCASPSLKSLPRDMVRSMVKNIEGKPGKSCNGLATLPPSAKGFSSVRKNLTDQLSGKGASKRPRSSFIANLSQSINNGVTPEDFSVTVAVRVRPFNQKEKDNNTKQVVFMHENETTVSDGSNEHSFAYDFSFDSIGRPGSKSASQLFIYEKLARPLLSAAFNGYNTCLFAYGQTGSGKSYTIMGSGEDVGVIPRFCEEMFGGVKAITTKEKTVQFHIEMSYFEIYNEKIHDLLVSSQVNADGEKKKTSLRVREHPESGPYVEGLSTFVVRTFADIQSWLDVGNQQRVTASTGMNDKSSRSHSVFILNMTRTTIEELEGERHESSRCSRINLVDLAGSERSSTAQTSGQRLKEGAHINKSLLTLGKVISMLSERSKVSARRQSRIFVPYRDSALTWLLKESLGGNSRTAMIATVSPADSNMEETLSTLRYAAQARTIVNSVKINEDPNAAIIRDLKAEIAKLRSAHQSQSITEAEYRATIKEVAQLKEKLAMAENDKDEANAKWKKKFEDSEKRKVEEIGELKRAGVSFKVDNRLPNLVNLNEDPQLSELLLYVIRHGVTRVGRKGGPHECEIQLAGALISDIHCEITNRDEVVTITPSNEDAKIFINGVMIEKLTTLHHGDRIVIAGDHFFRLNHPIEVQQKKKLAGGTEDVKKDFEFAKNELIMAQNARMEEEIEQARLRERQEMLKEIQLAKKEAQNELSEQREQYERVVESLKSQIDDDNKTKEQLEVIRVENLALQKEVETKRKIQGMKDEIMAEKYLEEKNAVFQNVFAELEAESKKLTEEIERMERNLKKSRESDVWSCRLPDGGKWTPLRISILLEEANKISKTMKKETLFSRYEPDSGPAQVKVENLKLQIWTLWSMEKFEEKLEAMRDSYSKLSHDSNESLSDSDENLFYDPADEWSEILSSTVMLDKKERLDDGLETPTSTKPRKPRRGSRRLSSITLAHTSPALKQSLQQYENSKKTTSLQSRQANNSILSSCKTFITNLSTQSSDCNESALDLFLSSLNELSSSCEKLTDKFLSQHESSADDQCVALENQLPLSATVQLRSSLDCVSFLQALLNNGQHHKSSAKLVKKVSDGMKKIAGELAKLFQGVEGSIELIVKESSGKIRLLVPNLAKCAGALSLAMKLDVNVIEEQREHLMGYRIKNALIQGADSFLRKSIAEGISVITNDSHTDDKNPCTMKVIQSALDLLHSCKELQDCIQAAAVRDILNSRICEETLRLHDTSLLIRETDLPQQYYQQYLKRTKGMMEVVEELVQKILDSQGNFYEVKKPLCELTRRIATLSLPSDTFLMPSNESYNENGNNSYINEVTDVQEETERMYYAVQEAAEDFLDILMGSVAGVGTHQTNVNLLATPTRNVGTRKLNISESTAISNSVKKALNLTDHVSYEA